MRKLLLMVGALLLITGLLAGCGADDGSDSESAASGQTEQSSDNQGSSEENEEVVTITISKDKEAEMITEEKIAVEEGDILMDVMEDNFEIETDFDGGFITSINGVAPKDGEQKSWMFFVNGEMPTKGAKEIELSPGDKISFDLQAWE
ncbi:DUF4430 domain-containing protein [Virgibacillus oceani]|uniref:Transcobalamin-like C-terminal domain-containing protein n=1 Tax=Virgibacillus oceani TaxID=1479511 RepID=A0A917H1I6_9BACI|nr:DUF4430 domain-containing protein [Virgibacillus oceani]GGG64966.1 hypothetical protein GCM10011398_05760 [Virgibacillus oceani]